MIDLSKATIFAVVEKNSKKKPLFFNIRSVEKNDHMFRTEDKLKKEEWIQALREASKKQTGPKAPLPNSPQNKPEMRKTQSEVMIEKNPKRRFSWSKKKE